MGKKIRWIPGIVGLCLVLGASGCAKSAGAGSSYALDQRIGTFAASGSGRTADGFAADLAVVTDETSMDETLTAAHYRGNVIRKGKRPCGMSLNGETLPARQRS